MVIEANDCWMTEEGVMTEKLPRYLIAPYRMLSRTSPENSGRITAKFISSMERLAEGETLL